MGVVYIGGGKLTLQPLQTALLRADRYLDGLDGEVREGRRLRGRLGGERRLGGEGGEKGGDVL